MPTYVVIAKTTSNPMLIDHITAPDLATATQQVRSALAKGVGVTNGVAEPVQFALVQADSVGTITPA